jgi:hypothetical protein
VTQTTSGREEKVWTISTTGINTA